MQGRSLTLFIEANSQPSRAVLHAALLMGVQHEVRWMRLDKGDHKRPEYVAKHPLGQVPAAELATGEVLFESNAILLYLAATSPQGSTWLPRDPLGAARVHSYLFSHAEVTRVGLATWFRTFAMIPLATGKEPDADKAARANQGLKKALDLFETHWLGRPSGPFVNGFTHPTLADLAAYQEFAQVTPFAPALLQPYPNIRAWMARLEELPHHATVMQTWRKVRPRREKDRRRFSLSPTQVSALMAQKLSASRSGAQSKM